MNEWLLHVIRMTENILWRPHGSFQPKLMYSDPLIHSIAEDINVSDLGLICEHDCPLLILGVIQMN